jgi:Pyrimidine dimer DNA glycosylase
MITFVPLPNYATTAACLDRRRLGKQRLEVLAIARALVNPRTPLHGHPACVMWWGAQNSLVEYGLAICDEWIERGYEDTLRERIAALKISGPTVPPVWLGCEAVHSSHRGNLLKKDPEWYGTFGWEDSPLLPYVWPTNSDPRIFRFDLHDPKGR